MGSLMSSDSPSLRIQSSSSVIAFRTIWHSRASSFLKGYAHPTGHDRAKVSNEMVSKDTSKTLNEAFLSSAKWIRNVSIRSKEKVAQLAHILTIPMQNRDFTNILRCLNEIDQNHIV
ncbi:hypothetical protein NPIL_353991 [Nephila pilipes]|uniref:Uncharacterized protein n=1 Tax=Nephila pilipes TaxID=299642 RepID=A0A8X6Q618_NEPPI|nr:hypothetical protein NPIL_353991 [Nephila pilipes]